MSHSAVCSVHGKTRTSSNLELVAPGQYRCLAHSQCQQGSGKGFGGKGEKGKGLKGSKGSKGFKGSKGGAKGDTGSVQQFQSTDEMIAAGLQIIHPDGPEYCHAHGKRRAPQYLYQVATPEGRGWECLIEERCNEGAAAYAAADGPGPSASSPIPRSARFSPYEAAPDYGAPRGGRRAGGAPGAFPAKHPNAVPGDQNAPVQCSIHGKTRSASNMEVSPTGLIVCRPERQCKLDGTIISSQAGHPRSMPTPSYGGYGGSARAPPAERGYGKGGGRGYGAPDRGFGAGSDERAECLSHGKVRSVTNLRQRPDGAWECTPLTQCR